MPETFELSELLKYVLSVVKKYQRPLVIPAELGEMVDTVNDALDELLASLSCLLCVSYRYVYVFGLYIIGTS